MKQSALQILEKLISFQSVTGDHEGINQAIEYIDRFVSECGMHVRRFEFNGVESLVATTKRTKNPKVMLYGHIDVVPGTPEQFKLRHEAGKLMGRGVIDMKAAIAAYLQLIYELQDNLAEYDLGLMIVGDEETGGSNGARRLINDKGYRPGVCIMPDGGSNWALESSAKGVWFIDVVARGTTTHGSRPWQGDNALDKLLAVVAEIKQLFPENNIGSSTCTLSRLHAGDVYNQVPDNAVASFDIRILNIAEDRRIRNAVAKICEQHGLRLEIIVYDTPYANDLENPYLRSFADSLEKTIGYPVGTTVSLASSDARFFAAKNVPCAVFYPTGGEHHGPGEWLSGEAFEQMQILFREYVEKEARIDLPTFEPAPELETARI